MHAKFHELKKVKADEERYEFVPNIEDKKETLLFKAAMKQGLKNFVKVFSAEPADGPLKYTKALADYLTKSGLDVLVESRTEAIISRRKKIPHTLCHGDVCNENMYLYDNGKNIMFVDFHHCKFGPGLLDIQRLLNLCVESPLKVEKELLSHYA